MKIDIMYVSMEFGEDIGLDEGQIILGFCDIDDISIFTHYEKRTNRIPIGSYGETIYMQFFWTFS